MRTALTGVRGCADPPVAGDQPAPANPGTPADPTSLTPTPWSSRALREPGVHVRTCAPRTGGAHDMDGGARDAPAHPSPGDQPAPVNPARPRIRPRSRIRRGRRAHPGSPACTSGRVRRAQEVRTTWTGVHGMRRPTRRRRPTGTRQPRTPADPTSLTQTPVVVARTPGTRRRSARESSRCPYRHATGSQSSARGPDARLSAMRRARTCSGRKFTSYVRRTDPTWPQSGRGACADSATTLQSMADSGHRAGRSTPAPNAPSAHRSRTDQRNRRC